MQQRRKTRQARRSHPATFALLFQQQLAAKISLVTTYPIDEIDVEPKREHAKKQRKRVANRKPALPDWTDADDALGTLVRSAPAGNTVLAQDGTPRK